MGLAVVGCAVFVAVATALDAPPPTAGVAAAETVRTLDVSRTVTLEGVHFTVTRKTNGDVCYSGPGIHSCTSVHGGARLSYATGRSAGRAVVGGIAGLKVHAVILKVTGKGTVWPQLRGGAFYAVLPRGRHLRAIVKVLAGGQRVTFQA